MYEKEVVDQEAKIEKMKAENKDEYDIKKQVLIFMSSPCHPHCFLCIYYRLKFFKSPRTWYQIAKEDLNEHILT